jgi:hypothetical protein
VRTDCTQIERLPRHPRDLSPAPSLGGGV